MKVSFEYVRPSEKPKVLTGQSHMSTAGLAWIFNRYFDVTVPMTQFDLIMMSRAPRTITSWGNIVSPFRLDTWLSVLIVLIVIAISLLVSHRVYVLLKIPVKDEPSPINFFLFTLCKVTEPEPLPWFRSGTAGHLFVFIWTVFACIMVLFYLSNLRAYLMTLQHEEPIESLQDVVDNNRRVWMQNSLVSFT